MTLSLQLPITRAIPLLMQTIKPIRQVTKISAPAIAPVIPSPRPT